MEGTEVVKTMVGISPVMTLKATVNEVYTHVSNKGWSKIKSLLDLITKNSYNEKEDKGYEG